MTLNKTLLAAMIPVNKDNEIPLDKLILFADSIGFDMGYRYSDTPDRITYSILSKDKTPIKHQLSASWVTHYIELGE